ncbi:PQQ-dependent sugar dehydrogenase [Pelagibacterales bacterium SAG-MED27]|nr:PQQ-dependent sugar dehydrogenase [Pelagibacterales bacterium SAG-MED27]
MKKIKLIISLFIVIFVSYLFLYSAIGENKYNNLKNLISNEHKKIIKDIFFRYKILTNKDLKTLEDKISELSLYKELHFRENLNNIKIIKSEDIILSNNKILEKYTLIDGFYSTINSKKKKAYPVGYLDFYNKDIFILSSHGILAYKGNLNDKENFTQIKNNINKFIGYKQFQKGAYFSLRDLYIHKNKIFISYVEEIKENCWNTSAIYGDINYENIIFKKLFSAKDCVHSINNTDKEFAGTQSGARIFNFDDNHVLLSIGDFRSRHLAQNKDSVNGKIIKINIHTKNFEIISMGHRNPQGLYFDKDKNFIIETEHGPKGGDEINIIEVDKINKNKILNYGWAIVSDGEHYTKTKKKYEKYPLYKSHTKYGFIEPIKSFKPSIGISQIIKIKKNKYVVSSMKDRSLYFFELDSKKKIKNLNRVEVFERVRDLNINGNKLYLFLEGSASIGVINLN